MLNLRRIFVVGAFGIGLACGLRTDPGSGAGVACVDNDTDGTPAPGSCSAPFPVTYTDGERFQGTIEGCSEGQSWCGGSGGEDYYLYRPHRGDVKVTFNTVAGGVEPLLRVVRVPAGTSPCGNDIPEENTQVCAPITNDEPSRTFYAGGADWDHYIVVDSVGGSTGAYDMTLTYGIAELSNDCHEQVPREEEIIVLGRGGSFSWEATLGANVQGYLDGKCGGPGDEDLFAVSLIEPGTLHVAVEALTPGFQPIAGIARAPGCAGESGLRCEVGTGGYAETEYTQMEAGVRAIYIDQAGISGGQYRMTAWMD